MLFTAGLTFAVALIALTMAASLLLKAKKHADLGTKPCQVIGYVVIVLSIVMLVISTFAGIRNHRFMKTMHKKYMTRMMMMKPKQMRYMQQGMQSQPMMQQQQPMMQQPQPMPLQQPQQMQPAPTGNQGPKTIVTLPGPAQQQTQS